MEKYQSNLFLFFILFFTPILGYAQMFSVGDPERVVEAPLGTKTTLGISWEISDFTYVGEGAPDDQRADFDDTTLRVRFEAPGLHLNMGFGGSLTGMSNTSYFNVGGRLFNDFRVVRGRRFFVAVPLQLTTDLKSVQRNNSDFEFQQSSFTFGSGASGAIRLSRRFDFELRSVANYGFSFSQGNIFGGDLFRFDGKARLFINNLFGSHGIAIGYDLDYREYNIEGNLNDYNFTSHSVTVGYAF